MMFVRDGPSPKFSGAIASRFTSAFRNRRIYSNSAVQWPPQSPDLSPLHFYLWEHSTLQFNIRHLDVHFVVLGGIMVIVLVI
jgi:hypothetical protein